VLAAKVRGSHLLDEATRDEPLDVFVLFSSITGVFGNLGQADYAYANAFLDEFAQWRELQRRRGQRSGTTLAIDWPAWVAGGMKTSAAVEETLARAGLAPVDAENGFRMFETALRSGEHQVLALLGDPDRIRLDPVDDPAPAVRSESAQSG
jgi:hypothetical protein